MNERLAAYLKADRVWLRPQRIAHARFKLRQAKEAGNNEEVVFYATVINANKWRPFRETGKST